MRKIKLMITSAILAACAVFSGCSTKVSEPTVGHDWSFAKTTCGEYTAELKAENILGITSEENGRIWYVADGISIFLTDREGRTVRAMAPGSQAGAATTSVSVGCYGDCLETPPQFYEVKTDSKVSYIIVQEYFNNDEPKVKSVVFYVCSTFPDPEDNECMELRHYQLTESLPFGLEVNGRKVIGSDGATISDSFKYEGDGVFSDSELGYKLTFDTETYKVTAEKL